MTIEENRQALIEAHRSQDWESARLLSQDRQRLKRKRFCLACGTRINKGINCFMHDPRNLAMKSLRWLAFSLVLLCLPAKAQLQSVTLQIQMIVDTNSLAGLSLADYCTNQWLEVLSSTNAATPTNQWPTLAWFPASQFLNQGLPPVWWTNQMLVDTSTRFYLLRCTNGTGGLGPFSSVVAFFWTAPQGRINVKR